MIGLAAAALAVGFFGSVPVAGPVAVVVFKRSIEGRPKSALATAWAAAVGEGLYAFAAAIGMGLLIEGRPWVARLSTALAAVLLAVVAVGLWRAKPADANADLGADIGAIRGALAGFTLVALNPTMVATWSVVVSQFVAFGLYEASLGRAAVVGLGAAVGCGLWFTVLIVLVGRLRARATTRVVLGIQRTFAVFVLGLAVYFAYSTIASVFST
jgi:threonine/homoserine/homoserine lactone efflux protein